MNRFQIGDRNPALGNQALLRHVQVEEIQRVVDGLDLAHLDEPVLDVLGRSDQHPVAVVLSLAEDRVQIFDASHDADGHFATFGRRFRTGVECGAKAFTDLLDSRLELVTLKEDDEHRLVNLVALTKQKHPID